jgi:simple sugar transport system substrate-binding protein/ribose transport system substrate-binding protein
VWAATDELALAAEPVLKAAGLGRDRVALVSTGGTDAAFERLRDPDGLLAATLAIPYELLGEAAVDALDDLTAGTPAGQITPGPYLFIEPVLVDRNNVPGPEELPW